MEGLGINIQKLEQLVLEVTEVLKNEVEHIRPKDDLNRSGGIIHLFSDIPTILIPDLHGRYWFLKKVLDSTYQNKRIQDHLKDKTIQLVCVGDGMHAEARAKQRWLGAYEEYQEEFQSTQIMDIEMRESFQTMSLVMKLKILFPQHFHFLKGNHENIKNENAHGNFQFGKFVLEGEMVRSYVEKFLGSAFLENYSIFEYELPLLAIGNDFIVSHAQPREEYQYQEILNYRTEKDVVIGLTWTANKQSPEGTVPNLLKQFSSNENKKKYWFAGHRPIAGKYNSLEKSKFFQIHNPKSEAYTLLIPGTQFDPERDIFSI
ncbi:MAG: hypothetical protein ACI86H_000638 [bacterium]|jgi:hypothetical protein